MTETQNIQNLITATIEAKATAELLDMLDLLEGDKTAREIQATIVDTIATRHNLNDALDTIAFADVEFIGTSREEIALAMTMVAA
ncbi:hypothetical protein E3T54_03005 [Cryobacterium sp. Sr8]|uniref:hypothetical protein n=1 Tax=Cryobacterium sp. Sr8 TaxID=1259203 RepID=UPI00106BC305|nr:hypothetical protein [Cryobacterium sp. Sr8]TFD80726.1 hypothetical protein E3T54_03005 [Cryobacterium sp. Sr8]